MTAAKPPWGPPFESIHDWCQTCPCCRGNGIEIEEQDEYEDGEEVDAYCARCKATLGVWVTVDTRFMSPHPKGHAT